MPDSFIIQCRYCKVEPQPEIRMKKINNKWIPFEIDNVTRHVHRGYE
jgi:hypothetical protein